MWRQGHAKLKLGWVVGTESELSKYYFATVDVAVVLFESIIRIVYKSHSIEEPEWFGWAHIRF